MGMKAKGAYGKVAVDEGAVIIASFDEGLVGTDGEHLFFVEKNHLIGAGNGGKAMGHQEKGFVFQQRGNPLKYRFFRETVQRRGGFVQD